MKTKMFTLIMGLLFFSTYSFAKIFRVGYTGTPLAGVDYASNEFQQAVTNANPGDTIQLYGTVSGAEINKRLVILGFGYNLDAHSGLQVNSINDPSYTSYIFFAPGSDGSIVKGVSTTTSGNAGFQVGDYYQTGTPVSNITFERCFGLFNLLNKGAATSNVRIISCVCTVINMYYGDNGIPLNNLQITNCILGSVSLFNESTTASIINCVSSPNTQDGLSFQNAQVMLKNSVIYPPNSGTNTIYQNNFIYSSAFTLPAGSSNNHWDVGFDDIFNELGVASSYNTGTPTTLQFNEDWYLLKPGSPAINAGLNFDNQATDCGIFGGELSNIYRQGGIPSIPAIYKLDAPGSEATSNPYKIVISVRSNN